MAVKYSAIIGSLGQTSDRFMRMGYKDPAVDKVEFPDVIKELEKTKCIQGADLYQAPEGPLSDPDTVNEILKTTGFTVAGGDLEKRALHLEVENMRCRSVCMSEKQVAQHLRQHLQIPSGYLFIGGVTC